MRTIIIGDIHGCYFTLLSLLMKVKYNKETDTLVFVGDYIDRGKNSYEVVEYLIKLQREVGKDKCVCLMGNHEHMAMGGLYGIDMWKQNGGTKTIKSYYKNNVSQDVHHWWFKQLPLTYETDDFICCHAGLPNTLIEDNTAEDMLWDRDWIEIKTEPNEKLVIFGHTPECSTAYKTPNGNICIDSGCVFGYNLCAMVYESKDKYEFIYESKDEYD